MIREPKKCYIIRFTFKNSKRGIIDEVMAYNPLQAIIKLIKHYPYNTAVWAEVIDINPLYGC